MPSWGLCCFNHPQFTLLLREGLPLRKRVGEHTAYKRSPWARLDHMAA